MSDANNSPDEACVFETEKAKFLRFADTLRKAQSAKQLLDLLQADVTAPYHTFDLLWLAGIPESIGCELAALMSATLDENGVPQ